MHEMEESDQSPAVILEAPGRIAVRDVPIPDVGSPWVEMELGACGICGSDVRYYQGENPWSLHTLGKNVPSPPNMILGHEVAGTVVADSERKMGATRRAAVLAYRACGVCPQCLAGRENLCAETQHFGHGAGWDERNYYPGGMARRFRIWRDFAYDIPESISFEDATFLDGLAVALHAVRQGGVSSAVRVGVVGLGPIGMLAAQVARALGAEEVWGCDQYELPVRLARESGFEHVVHAGSDGLVEFVRSSEAVGSRELDVVLDTVGNEQTVMDGLRLLAPSGRLVLLAVHESAPVIPPLTLSGERSVVSSANNLYREFPEAIDLMASGAVRVAHLVTHRFPLERAETAFRLLADTGRSEAFKVVLTPS